ncbi:MAG: hypothetical protein A2161_02725 [Candidatus Schekmanbacteria bacterium RBG_13_48_7]|uniref:Uncharacterized protein n=1 Tax=Candidatus Schekmanbacteria bacterium RBG_13_48_7 TaxID=1817878 RepID=A0A1F7S342_9BACT|nr:MAG: hypothetical protein A2161_02725 [Candidatus Schekmanbacteria bacterium RBG_13_48_7]
MKENRPFPPILSFVFLTIFISLLICSCDDNSNNNPTPTPEPTANLEISFIPDPCAPVLSPDNERYEWIFTMIISETNGVSVELTDLYWLEHSNADRIKSFFGTYTVPGGGQIQAEFTVFKTLEEGGGGGPMKFTIIGIDAKGNDVSASKTLELLSYQGQ